MVVYTAEANGLSLAYHRTGGDKPPVVLLHGLMGSGIGWDPVARLLEGELDVIRPDARGHGDSSAPKSGYRYSDLAADVVGLISELNLVNPVLVGHSMGGMTAALAATQLGPVMRGLVLVDPTFLEAPGNAKSMRAMSEPSIVSLLTEAGRHYYKRRAPVTTNALLNCSRRK